MRSLAFLFLLFSFASSAQEDLATVSKGFTIVLSTKSYDAALKVAKEASEKLQIEFQERGNYPNPEGGLSNDEICECGESHGYLPRGRYDDGKYVSIEYSSSYSSFAEGYYIVIVNSGDRKELEKNLPSVRDHFKNAYVKNDKVYVGCMH